MSMVTGKGKEKSGKRRVTEMHISRAENGFTASRHFEKPKASKQAKMSMPDYEPPENNVFGDHQALAQHVADSFGDDQDGAAAGAMPNSAGADESE